MADNIKQPLSNEIHPTSEKLLETILGREVQDGERLSDDDKMKVARHVMAKNRKALAMLAKS